MPVLSKRGLRKLQKVLEDWISEDWSDASDDGDLTFTPSRSARGMRTMEHHRSDAASSSTSEHPGTSSEDERLSSRMSSCSSAATDRFPPPPKYESVVQHPVKDYSKKDSRWEREVDQLVGDFDRKCSSYTREHNDGLGMTHGAESYVHEERSSRRSVSPPRTNSSLGSDRNWDRSLLANDEFFRDSPLRQRRPFGGRPFGGMRSAFGEDMDRFFGRGTFSTDWDTFFPDITFSGLGHASSLSPRSQAKSRDVQVVKRDEDFKVEVDVQGFEPHELLVKTVGQSLLVMARTEAVDEADMGTSRKRDFKELRREFTIPPTVNPTEITSDLTPDGVLVIQAPTRDELAIESRDEGDRTKSRNSE